MDFVVAFNVTVNFLIIIKKNTSSKGPIDELHFSVFVWTMEKILRHIMLPYVRIMVGFLF